MNGPEIAGSLTRIRPLREADAEARWELVNDGDSRRLIPVAETDFKQVRNWCATAAERPDRYDWAVTALDSDEFLGEVQLVDLVRVDRRASLRMAMRRAFRGRGYAFDFTPLVLDFAFAPEPAGLGLHRVSAEVLSSNIRVGTVLEAVGFTAEGRLRQTHPDGDRWLDTLVSGLLAPEWAELRHADRGN